jgi:hypothetical protein
MGKWSRRGSFYKILSFCKLQNRLGEGNKQLCRDDDPKVHIYSCS